MFAKLSIEERARLIGHFQAGTSVTDCARLFNITRLSEYKIIDKHRQNGQMKDLPRSGRPRLTSPGEDDAIVQHHIARPFDSAVQTAQSTGLNRQTVVRRLKEAGLNARKPVI